MSGSPHPFDSPGAGEGNEWAEQLMTEAFSAMGKEPVSVEPQEALEMYLEDKERECAKATVNSHRSRLGTFIDWCENHGIDDLSDLSAQHVLKYRKWRRKDGDLAPATEKTQMDTLRVFLKWCDSIDAVRPGLHRKVRSPNLNNGENIRDRMIDPEDANRVLDYLDTYEYATPDHVVWLLLTSTGMRLGTLYGLDLKDFHGDAEPPHLTVKHRPEADTPLKNGKEGERSIALTNPTAETVTDYIEAKRHNETDDHGRDPLLATQHGRLSKPSIRKYVYRWSRPCVTGAGCPHDRDPDTCEATQKFNDASKCPSSLTPHPIRRAYITKELQSDVPKDVVSDRCNVTPSVIDAHYDQRTETDKMLHRKRVLDQTHQENDNF
jgi:site-specific recombinase XerD